MKHVLFYDFVDSPFESSSSFLLSWVTLMCSEYGVVHV